MFGDSKTRLSMPTKEQADVEDDLEGAEIYTEDELAVFEGTFKSEDGNLLTAFYLGIYCGLRISECFALRWSNVNWKEKTITVNRQMHNVGWQITLTKVKTMTAIRTVLMPSFLQDYLDSLFQEQRKDKAKANGHYRDTERVYDEVSKEWLTGGDFINRKHNGELLTVNSVNRIERILLIRHKDGFETEIQLFGSFRSAVENLIDGHFVRNYFHFGKANVDCRNIIGKHIRCCCRFHGKKVDRVQPKFLFLHLSKGKTIHGNALKILSPHFSCRKSGVLTP